MPYVLGTAIPKFLPLGKGQNHTAQHFYSAESETW